MFAFNKHRAMYSVSCIVHCVEIACKDLFFIQQHSNKQSQALQALVSGHIQHFFGSALHFRFYNYITLCKKSEKNVEWIPRKAPT